MPNIYKGLHLKKRNSNNIVVFFLPRNTTKNTIESIKKFVLICLKNITNLVTC